MAAEQALAAVLPPRVTPPSLVRSTISALALFGWLVGLSGASCCLSAVHFNSSAAQTTTWLAAAVVAATAGLIVFNTLLADWPANRVLAFAAALGAAALTTLAAAYENRLTYAAGAMLGLAVAAAAVEATRQITRYGQEEGSGKLADLAACSWPAGAAAACLLTALGRHFLSFASLSLGLAICLGAFAAAWLRLKPATPVAPAPSAERWAGRRQPAFKLQFASALFQALVYGLIAAWIGVYMSRKVGLTAAGSTLALAVVWLALLTGRAAASRYKAAMQPRFYLAVLLIWVVGALFLVKTTDRSGALVACLLVGVGAGALQPLSGVPALFASSDEFKRLLPLLFKASVGAGLAGALVGGWLVQSWGMEALVWVALGAQALATLASFGAAVEARLFRGVTVDPGRPA